MEKKIKVIVDGVELEVLVSEEELAKLTEKKQKKTGYERVYKGKRYFLATGMGFVDTITEVNNACDNSYFENANYYNDKTLAENNARADKLMRQLRRFAAENCEEVTWNDSSTEKYYITYYTRTNKLGMCRALHTKVMGVTFFDTEENAQKAIDTFKDELIWYFTEYRDRV